GLAQLLVHADGHELDDAVRDPEAALDFLHHLGLAFGHEQDVGALTLAPHEVGQALLPPLLDLLDLRAFLLDVALDLRGERVHLGLAEVGVGDEQDLVNTIAQLRDPPSGSRRAPEDAAEEPLSGPTGLTGSKESAGTAAPTDGLTEQLFYTFRGPLNRVIAAGAPSAMRDSTASAARPTASCTTSTSSSGKGDSTYSARSSGGSPLRMPTRTRGISSLPSDSISERSPLWPPWLPRSRTRSTPSSRTTSSRTTIRSSGRPPRSARSRATGSPLRFMKAWGLTRRTSAPPARASASHAPSTPRPGAAWARAARTSATMNPTLCRVRR